MSNTRKDALARVIACRLYALTEEQLERLDHETTEMLIDATEGEIDSGQIATIEERVFFAGELHAPEDLL